MPLPPSALAIPRGSLVAGRYQLLAPLGRGGIGTVYEAIDTVTDRVRALKIVDGRVDDDTMARFQAEGTLTGRVESPYVVDVFDRGHDPALDVLFLVMDRLRGEDLGALLDRDGRLSTERATTLLSEVAAGLEALHGEGVVHRDLKPENVFLAREGALTRAVIVDLGLAKSFIAAAAKTTRAIGTPLYMAPEQLRGDALIDARADIYAFGHLAFAMLVGKPYFAVEHARSTSLYALLLQVAKGPPEPASARARSSGIELPPGFDAWFARATAPEPEDRFETAADAASRLGPALLALAPAPEAGARASARRRPIAAAALAAGLVVVGGSVFAIATRVNATAATPVTPLDPNAASLPAIAPPSAAPVEAMPSFPLVTAPSAAPAPPQAVVTARAPKRVATPPSTHRSKPPHDPLDSL